MLLKNVIQLSIVNLTRNKFKNILYIGLIGFCIVFLFISYTLAVTSYISIDNNINNIADYRTLQLQINNENTNLDLTQWINKLTEHPDISMAYPYFSTIEISIEEFNTSYNQKLVLDSGSALHIPKTTKGRGFNEKDENVLILPSAILMKDEENQLITIETAPYLGKTLTIMYPSNINGEFLSYKCSVIGIYELEEDKLDKSEIYATLTDYYHIVASQSGITSQQIYEPAKDYSLAVIVNDYRDFKSTIMDLYNTREYVVVLEEKNMIDTGIINTIKIISMIMFCIIISLTFLTISIVIDHSISERINEIALLKAIGYNYKHLFSIIFSECFILSTISYIKAIIISEIFITLIINPILKTKVSNELINIYLKSNINTYLIIFIIIGLFSLFSSIRVLIKTNKISPQKLIRAC